jgi:hypothetical protein
VRQLWLFSFRATALALGSAIAAQPAAAASSQDAAVNSKVVKPLTVSWVQDLDLGTITLAPGSWSNASVGISRAGLFSCTDPNVTCTGATKVARYNITGSNNQTVRITAPNVTMTNQADSTKTLVLVVDSPGSVLLTSSGAPGVNFSLGGTLNLSSTTAAGTYAGTFNVTVDY